MSEREQQIDIFLVAAGWSDASRAPLAGDASGRIYQRLARDGQSAVLMDSRHEDIAPFLHIARHLESCGFSVPTVYAADSAQRLLLLEDLGEFSFVGCLQAGVAGDDSVGETALYGAAVDVLAALAAEVLPSSCRVMDGDYLADEIGLFTEWWLPQGGTFSPLVAEGESWVAAWRDVYASALAIPAGLALRDFHAENLVWLAARKGNRRIGLLDFQDALQAPISYDLVSLLQDVRRDVPENVQAEMIERFMTAFPDQDRNAFLTSYAILGAHRNLRIAGIFSRLAGRDGKREYLKFLPRLWRHIEINLRHPALAPVQEWLAHHVPAGQREGG